MPDQRQSTPELRRSVLSYAHGLNKAHQLAGQSLRHNDRMLTWIIGLTGAAMFALPEFVTSMCSSTAIRSVSVRAVVGAWTAAIALGLVARIIGAYHRDADDLFFLSKWSALRSFVVGPGDRPQAVSDILNDQGAVGERKEATVRYRRWFNWPYYATLGLSALGAALLFWSIARC